MRSLMAFLAVAGLVALGNMAQAEDAKRVGDAYALGTCAVSGEKLGGMGEPVVKIVDGREVRLCCGGCSGKLESEKAALNEKLDKAMVEDQKSHYPTDKCVNSGAPLGDSPTEFVAGNRLMKTCCGNCAAKVKADPTAAIAKLDTAAKESQGKTYALKTCPVSGEPLGSMGDPVEVVVANRLVKLCCQGCAKGVEKDPAGVLSKVDAAAKG